MNESEEFSTIDDAALEKSKQPTEPAIEAGSSKQGITPTGLFLVMLTVAIFGVIVWFIVSIWTTPPDMATPVAEAPTEQVEQVERPFNPTSIPGRDPNILGVRMDPTIGPFFTAGETGLTLYITREACIADCPEGWEPYVTDTPRSPGALTTQPIDTDETIHQYTWHGEKLYRYTADTKPGDVLGDGYNGVWTIARP